MASIKTEYGVITYNDSPEVHKRVFDFLVENYFKKYDAFCGETIMQSDNPQIYAPEVLSDIADDIIQFEHTEDEDDE